MIWFENISYHIIVYNLYYYITIHDNKKNSTIKYNTQPHETTLVIIKNKTTTTNDNYISNNNNNDQYW